MHLRMNNAQGDLRVRVGSELTMQYGREQESLQMWSVIKRDRLCPESSRGNALQIFTEFLTCHCWKKKKIMRELGEVQRRATRVSTDWKNAAVERLKWPNNGSGT